MTDHWPRWVHFVKAETAVHGPDCQLALLHELGQRVRPSDIVEQVWLCGAYGAHHCVPSAFAIWQNWRPVDVLEAYDTSEFHDWLESHWSSLPVRPEMRSHRMVDKRARCLRDFAKYALDHEWSDTTKGYEDLWNESQQVVKYYGRYMAIKYLELLRRCARPDLVLTDMRAEGGWSPRIALGLLFPAFETRFANRTDNSKDTIQAAEACAVEAIQRLAEHHIHISHFQLQVLLCNYREMIDGTFYPGAGHDEEMDYLALCTDFPDEVAFIYETRKQLFPHVYLGELNDWTGIRKSEYQRWKNLTNYALD